MQSRTGDGARLLIGRKAVQIGKCRYVAAAKLTRLWVSCGALVWSARGDWEQAV